MNFDRLMMNFPYLGVLFFAFSAVMSFTGIFGAYMMISAGYAVLTGHYMFSDRVVDCVNCADLEYLLGANFFFCAVVALFVLIVIAKKIKSSEAKAAEQPNRSRILASLCFGVWSSNCLLGVCIMLSAAYAAVTGYDAWSDQVVECVRCIILELLFGAMLFIYAVANLHDLATGKKKN